jgi:hypothetical protein
MRRAIDSQGLRENNTPAYPPPMMNKNLLRSCAVLGVILWGMGLATLAANPQAVDDTATTPEDTAITIHVLDNDTPGTNPTLHISSPPGAGTVTVNAGGTITYTPETGFHGTDFFFYYISATEGDSSAAKVTITVSSVNNAPEAADNFYATPADTPVTVTLKATDPDIDPLFPKAHPLTFAIVTGPNHGTLSDDLANVTYETPHTAIVTLTYTPNAAFSGRDSFVFSVTDSSGATSNGTIDIQVGVPKEEGALAGRLTSYLTVQGQTFSISSFTSTLTAIYLLGSFRAQANASLTLSGLSGLSFSVSFPLGEATVYSSLSFNPSIPAFSGWSTTTRLTVLGVGFTHTFYLANTAASSYNQLTAVGTIGDISVTSTTKLTGLDFCFDSQIFSGRWSWCDTDLLAQIDFSTDGFDEFSLTAYDVPLLPEKTIGLGINLDLVTTFTTTSKTVDVTFDCTSDWLDCFRVLCAIESTGMSIDGVSFYGLQFQASLPNNVQVRTDTSFDPDQNATLTGYADYWERLRISGSATSCCGAPGYWDISTFFKADHISLFDWGRTTLTLNISLADAVEFYTQATFQSTDPIWQWTLGGTVRW